MIFNLQNFKMQLCHLLDEIVDVMLSVAIIATFGEVVRLLLPTTSWVIELKWPEEVGNCLKVWTSSHNLVDNILNADNTLVTESIFNDGIVGERSSSLLHLPVATLVDKVSDRLEVWVT